MSKKKLNGNEINKISAGINAKDVGYGALGTVALAGSVAALGCTIKHACSMGYRKELWCDHGYYKRNGWSIFHTGAATAAGLVAASSIFAFGKIGKSDTSGENP